MTGATLYVEGTPLPRAARATPGLHAATIAVPGGFRRAAGVAGDLVGIAAIALSIPFVVLAIATPIALGAGLLMRLAGLL